MSSTMALAPVMISSRKCFRPNELEAQLGGPSVLSVEASP